MGTKVGIMGTALVSIVDEVGIMGTEVGIMGTALVRRWHYG